MSRLNWRTVTCKAQNLNTEACCASICCKCGKFYPRMFNVLIDARAVCLWRAGKVGRQGPWKILIHSSASFQTCLPCHQDFVQKWHTPCSVATFCGSGVPQCQLSSAEMLLFPILKRKGSLIQFFLWTNWGFAPFSPCSWKVPLMHWGTWSRACRFISVNFTFTTAALWSCWTLLTLCPWRLLWFYAQHFSRTANSFILNFNKWVTHSSLMPQVLCHKFVFFFYRLTMLHTFPDDITRVTESTYFALAFCSPPSLALPLPQILIRLIFNKCFSFHVAEKNLTGLLQEATQTSEGAMCCSSLSNECLWEDWVSWFLLWGLCKTNYKAVTVL